MSDTPETDAFTIKFKTICGEKYWVPIDFSKKLERERNDLREKVYELINQLQENGIIGYTD
jgi:hypothetical protein